MKELTAVLFFILLLSSCATKTTLWTKAGAGQQDLVRDTYECRKDLATVRGPNPYYTGLAQVFDEAGYQQRCEEMFSHCMRAKGWYPIVR